MTAGRIVWIKGASRGFRVQGLGFWAQGFGFRVKGFGLWGGVVLGFRGWSLGLKGLGFWLGAPGLRFGALGLGCHGTLRASPQPSQQPSVATPAQFAVGIQHSGFGGFGLGA